MAAARSLGDRNILARPIGCRAILRARSSIAPAMPDSSPGQIDKCALTLAEPKRFARQGASEVCSITAVPYLRSSSFRSASPALCPTAEHWVSKSAMSSLCRSAVAIIDNCIRPETRCPGGKLNDRRTHRREALWEQTHANGEHVETQIDANASETTAKN